MIMKKTNKQIELAYAKMLEQNKEVVAPNRVNCYVCKKCEHITKTIDIDSGVTPFMHQCEKCKEFATSTFYRDIAPDLKPTQEWYRPSLEQVMKMHRKEKFNLLDHILQGGLDVRMVAKNNGA